MDGGLRTSLCVNWFCYGPIPQRRSLKYLQTKFRHLENGRTRISLACSARATWRYSFIRIILPRRASRLKVQRVYMQIINNKLCEMDKRGTSAGPQKVTHWNYGYRRKSSIFRSHFQRQFISAFKCWMNIIRAYVVNNITFHYTFHITWIL